MAKQCGLKEVFVVGEAEGCRPISQLFQDVAILSYFSGTTGAPKGVMLTHFNLFANIQQFADRPGYLLTTLDDIVLGVLPFFHIYGFTVVMGSSLCRGATVVSLPRFELELVLKTIQIFEVNETEISSPMIVRVEHLNTNMHEWSPVGSLVSISIAYKLRSQIGFSLYEIHSDIHSIFIHTYITI